MRFDAVVCGGGAVGLAVARELSSNLRNVLLLEQHSILGSETSSRNSEVIHAGLYYGNNTLKHQHCLAGSKLLYDYLNIKNIRHFKIGKLVVASDAAEFRKLELLYKHAEANGVGGLCWLDRNQIRELEPELKCVAGFLSKNSGIFDSHMFLQALRFDCEDAGVTIATSHRFSHATIKNSVIEIKLENLENDPIYTKRFYNCAGLHAIEVMKEFEFDDPKNSFRYEYAKGSYFSLSGKSPFQRLIYPIPENGGLGVHSTLDCNGRTKFGPNVDWTNLGVEELTSNYAVEDSLETTFKSAIKRYWPGIVDRMITPDYSGFRPKLFVNEKLHEDFKIVEQVSNCGCEVMHLLGIESPGLTSCLSLANYLVKKNGG